MKRRLTGIGWDHPRGFGCYEGSGVAFMREHPDIELVWEKRSLRAFGEAPIDDLAELYDLVVFDHPFVGRAHATRAFLDLKEIVPDVVSAALADELGQAARSYHFAGGVYGLPTDAAAQVSAYRVNGRVKVSQRAAQNVATLGLARSPGERALASGRPRFS